MQMSEAWRSRKQTADIVAPEFVQRRIEGEATLDGADRSASQAALSDGADQSRSRDRPLAEDDAVAEPGREDRGGLMTQWLTTLRHHRAAFVTLRRPGLVRQSVDAGTSEVAPIGWTDSSAQAAAPGRQQRQHGDGEQSQQGRNDRRSTGHDAAAKPRRRPARRQSEKWPARGGPFFAPDPVKSEFGCGDRRRS